MQSTTSEPVKRRGMFERPDTPAQWYAAVAGLFLLALGILSLVIVVPPFGAVGKVGNQPQFLIWATSGWTSIFWIVMGALGLMALPRLDGARTYALVAGIVFAVVAVWGFIDGNNVFSLLAADTTNNITHAILGGLGLVVGMMPRRAQRPQETAATSNGTGRFSRTATTTGSRTGHTAGRS